MASPSPAPVDRPESGRTNFARASWSDVSLLVLVNLLWAGQYPAVRIAAAEVRPLGLTAASFVLATLLVLPSAWRARRARRARGSSAEPFPIGALLATGALGLVPASALLAWGTERAGAADASLMGLTIPLLTALLAAVVLREPLGWRHAVSLAVSLAGVLVLARADLHDAARPVAAARLGGLALLVGSCVSSTVYNVASKRLLERLAPVEALAAGYLIATPLAVALAAVAEPHGFVAVPSWRAIAAVLYLGAINWGLAMALWLRAIERLPVALASVSVYLLPFFGLVLSWLILGERLGLADLAGGALTLLGTAVLSLPRIETAAHPEERR